MTREQDQTASDLALKEFLANGGKIQSIPNNVSGREPGETYSQWAKKKPKPKLDTPANS
jgi:hypothetical protein